MQGLHLTADLHGCPAHRPAMTDAASLRRLCLAAVGASGLQPVAELFHRFEPARGLTGKNLSTPSGIGHKDGAAPVGVTGVVLLAESHLAVHTWPELAAVTLDVYVCNFGADNSSRAHALMAELVAAFEPASVQRHVLHRGAPEGGA